MEKVTLKGTFDASEILAGLKKIQQTMESSGMSSNLFTRMTEQMAAAESEINRVERKLREGFSSQKEFNAVENSIRSIYDQLNKITRGLSNVNTNQNIFDGLTRNMQKELTGLEKAIDSKKAELNKKLANFFESSLGVKNKVEAQNTAELIKNEQDLTKEVQKRYEMRQKEIALAERGLRSRIGQKKDELINAANLTVESFGGKKGSKGNLNTTINAINKLVEDPNVTVAQLRNRFTEQFYKENSQKGYSGDFVGLGAAREKYQVIKGGVVEAAAGTAEAKAAFDSLINSIVANAVNSVRTQTKKLTQERNSLQNVGTLDSSGKLVPGTALTAQVQVLNERQKEITALQEQYKAKQLAMNAPANTVSSTVEQNARAIEKQNAALKNSNKVMDENLKSTRAAIVENKNLYNTFDMLQYTIQRWFSAITIVSKLTQTIKKTFNEVRELDKSFASIAMVTDYSVQQMWESYDKYAQLANKLGQSTKDVIASSALFFQQGDLSYKRGMKILKIIH